MNNTTSNVTVVIGESSKLGFLVNVTQVVIGGACLVANVLLFLAMSSKKQLLKTSPLIAGLTFGDTVYNANQFVAGIMRLYYRQKNILSEQVSLAFCFETNVAFWLFGCQYPAMMIVISSVDR